MKDSPENKLEFAYGSKVICLPGETADKLAGAGESELKILIAAAGNPGASPEEICASCGIADAGEYASAIAFWRGAGILTGGRGHTTAVKKKADEIMVSVPSYTADEVSRIAENDERVRHMLDECTTILGRSLGETECIRLVSAVEYFNVTPEYLLLVCSHCARNGKKSVAAVVSRIAEFYKSGIEDAAALTEKLLGIEKTAKLETQVRQLVGMNMSRELTPRESNFISAWGDTYGYGIEIIRLAYEITVDAIGEPVLAYMDKILGAWYGDGLKTEEEIRAKLEAKKKARNNKKNAGEDRSFDTDDFFSAALKRTYGSAAPAVPKTDGKADGRNVGKTAPPSKK